MFERRRGSVGPSNSLVWAWVIICVWEGVMRWDGWWGIRKGIRAGFGAFKVPFVVVSKTAVGDWTGCIAD
jgi:hypothetical protein